MGLFFQHDFIRVPFLSLALVFLAQPAFAIKIQPQVIQEYLEMGGSPLALVHLRCFLENHSHKDFQLKQARLSERCNGMDGDGRRVNINNWKHVVIVDYTQGSSHRRFFVLDLDQPKRPYVESFYAAHGKYAAPTYDNTTPGVNQNTVEEIDYFSNVSGSNASSSGFYITGQVYQGRWVGPNKDKNSLIIHGINKDVNDNACDRAIVVHGNGWIQEGGLYEGVRQMSAGCFMLDYNVVNEVIEQIRGGGGSHFPNEKRIGGTLFFAYGVTEAALPPQYYCSSESDGALR